MSTPASFDHLGTRPFSFFPAILNIDHNEWLFRRSTWSEVLVVNCKTGEEIWISRRYVGKISQVDDPVLIVGLNRELEYRAGAIWPHQSRVIQMPVAVGGGSPTVEIEDSPPPRETRLPPPPSTEGRIVRLIGGAILVSILLYFGAVQLTQVGEVRQRSVPAARDQSYLELTSRDDYTAVLRKIGTPQTDRWMPGSGEIQYRALSYSDRKYTLILMGSTREGATYIGTMDDGWKPLHSVDLHSGGTTASLLRELRRF
jgi:hypothetical protein